MHQSSINPREFSDLDINPQIRMGQNQGLQVLEFSLPNSRTMQHQSYNIYVLCNPSTSIEIKNPLIQKLRF
jgi:hypothetical protein